MKIQVQRVNEAHPRRNYLTKSWSGSGKDRKMSYNTTSLLEAYDFQTVAEVYGALECYAEQWSGELEIVDRAAIDHMSRKEHANEMAVIMQQAVGEFDFVIRKNK